MSRSKQWLQSPIRLCKFCNQWKDRSLFKPTGHRCSTCQGNQQRRYSGIPKFNREMAIPGTPANEWAKAKLEELMTRDLLRGHEVKRVGHNRAPRFSHLPDRVRYVAERLLSVYMARNQEKLSGPNWGKVYGALVAVATRNAKWYVEGVSMGHYCSARHGLRNRIMYNLGLKERPVRQQEVEQ
jgi:hypothetical protein